MLLDARFMNNDNLQANLILENLFSHVNFITKQSKIILVKIENCTVYIPVKEFDDETLEEFREQFKIVYEKSREG